MPPPSDEDLESDDERVTTDEDEPQETNENIYENQAGNQRATFVIVADLPDYIQKHRANGKKAFKDEFEVCTLSRNNFQIE